MVDTNLLCGEGRVITQIIFFLKPKMPSKVNISKGSGFFSAAEFLLLTTEKFCQELWQHWQKVTENPFAVLFERKR